MLFASMAMLAAELFVQLLLEDGGEQAGLGVTDSMPGSCSFFCCLAT